MYDGSKEAIKDLSILSQNRFVLGETIVIDSLPATTSIDTNTVTYMKADEYKLDLRYKNLQDMAKGLKHYREHQQRC